MRANDVKKLSERDHVRLRAGMYVGQTVPGDREVWFPEDGKIVRKTVSYVPALIKLFDEIVGNSIDEALRTDFKFSDRIDVSIERTVVGAAISVADNGRGIPVVMDEKEKIYKSELAVTHLRAGANFATDDVESIGTNGVGSTAVNFLSKLFELETCDGKKIHRLTCEDGLSRITQNHVTKAGRRRPGTTVKFVPDYELFGVSDLDGVHEALIKKRVFDLAFCFPRIKFTFNGERVKSSSLDNYVRMYAESDGDFETLETEDGRRFAVARSVDGFRHVSFANGIDTYDGGSHLDAAVLKFTDELRSEIKKRYKFDVKPSDVKNNLLFVLSVPVKGAKFESQTKTKLTNRPTDLYDVVGFVTVRNFVRRVAKNEAIVAPILEYYRAKEQAKLARQIREKNKKLRKKKIPKLIEASGGVREHCILFITEGDSAASQALGARDPERHAFLPIRGKVLNALTAKKQRVLQNTELTSIMAAVGLEIGKKPENLNYGTIALLMDQDVDGDSIVAMLVNFFYRFWPSLLEQGRVKRVLSPLYIVKTADGETHRCYSREEYFELRRRLPAGSVKSVDYNKGLGGLPQSEYELMLSEPRYLTVVPGEGAEEALRVAFGDSADLRKRWIETRDVAKVARELFSQ